MAGQNNVWRIKIRTKDSSKTILSLVWFLCIRRYIPNFTFKWCQHDKRTLGNKNGNAVWMSFWDIAFSPRIDTNPELLKRYGFVDDNSKFFAWFLDHNFESFVWPGTHSMAVSYQINPLHEYWCLKNTAELFIMNYYLKAMVL